MQNQIIRKIMGNQFISKVVGGIGTFYVTHENVLLTTGTIGFSLATTYVTYKNASKINDVIIDARIALENCNTKEERNDVYSLMLKELAKYILPIILFQGATIGCALLSKRKFDAYDKKLAEAAGALSIAQTAIAQYQLFQKEAEESLGKEKYLELQDDIYKDKQQDFKGSEQVFKQFCDLPYEGAPGEDLFVCKYTGRPFWSNSKVIETATERMCYRIGSKGSCDQASLNDWYELIGNPNLTPTELGGKFGYLSFPSDDGDEITAHFSPTQVVFPNGTVKPAFEVTLYPEPAFLDSDY